MQTDAKSFQDYVEIAKRRKNTILLSVLIVFAIAVIVSLLMAPIYKSKSTILIEEQDIPRDYIVSTVAGYAEQRLQAINQRVMSSTKLIEIIKKYNLYSDLRKRWTIEEVIEKMRKDIKFETIGAELDDPRSGRSKVTIAFTISYLGENPATVQQISNVLASLYLEENLKLRGQQAESAARFFQEEVQSVQSKMAEMDAKLAAYKERNINSLPDLAQTNLQELYRLELNLDQLNDQLRTVREKESSLKTQLAGIPSDADLQEKNRLIELKAKLVNLKSRVSDEYPDVVKLKQEIAELESNSRNSAGDTSTVKGDSLSYVTIDAQHSATRTDIESIKRQIDSVSRKRDDFRRRIAVSPRVEEGYKSLFIQRTNLQLKYDDLTKKHMEANVAHGLEKEQMGERFTLIDPARLPEKPVRPNIPVFLLAGFFLGGLVGTGLAALKEAGDKSVYSVDALAKYFAAPIVAGIPYILTSNDIKRRKKRRNFGLILTLLLAVTSVVVVNYFVMDLDVFWARVVRRMAL